MWIIFVFISEKRYYYGYIYEKDVLIELISHILGLTSKTVEFENPDRLSLIYKRDELYGLKPEDIEYQKEIKFIKDKQAILEGLNNG